MLLPPPPHSAALQQALSAYEKQQAIVQASGTITIVGGQTILLTGTYDTVTQMINLSGGGYTLTGTVGTNNGVLTFSGTYMGPNGAGGFVTEKVLQRPPQPNQITAYCGTYVESGDNGTWNFTVSNSGSLYGQYASTVDGEGGILTGEVTGTNPLTVSGIDPGDGTPFSATITNGSVSGTYTGGTFVCTGGRGAFSCRAIGGDPLAPALARDGIDRARPPGPTAWLEAGCA